MNDSRWGAAMVRRRRFVITTWVVVILVCGGALPYLHHRLTAPGFTVTGADSARVTQLLRRHFAGQGTEQDVIVFDAGSGRITDPGARATVDRVVETARRQTGVVSVIGPFSPQSRGQVSEDGHAALAIVGVQGDVHRLPQRVGGVQDAVRDAAGGGVNAWLAGYTPSTNDLTVVESRDSERAESIGLPIALVVLVLALGTVVAALLPLLLAVAGLLLAFGVFALLSLGFSFDAFLLSIVTMIGTGIGIDYALFVVGRFREELARRNITREGGRQREQVAEAVGVALATSGRTIVFSGVIVAISVCSLYVMNSPIFREISTGVLVTVFCTLAAALTLLPAVLGALGARVNSGSLPARFLPADARPDAEVERGTWARWARLIMRRPVPAVAAAVAVLALAALPVGSVKYGIDLGTASLTGRPSAEAQKVLARSFSAASVSPVQIVVTGRGDTPLDTTGVQNAQRLADTLGKDPRIAGTQTVPGDGRVLINAVPRVAVDSTTATRLIRDIRDDLAPKVTGQDVLVGGATATFVDMSRETTTKAPYILTLVLGLSLLFLLMVFRSLVLPVKAVLMNLLVTAASVGATVAVFQWGHLESLFGFTSVGFLQVYIPITVFVLLFGLSMDYEVFLVRRMKESWQRTHDNSTAVADGIEHTARPIAAAAGIMVAVFGSFITCGILELKQFGLALALAIALDATLVRLVLVPAVMRLLGTWNWWMPRALSRRLPSIVEEPARLRQDGTGMADPV
jgi:RND superfamily putative drug exporter